MAIEKVVEIKVISEQAKKNINDINSVIDEQRAILVLLEEEYLKAKKAVDDYNASGKINLAQEKALKKTLSERKDALTDQRLGLKKLAIQQRAANKEAKEFRKEQKETTNIVRGIDKLTGGLATKVVKLTKGFKSGVKGIKGFIGGLSGVKKALLATGIGALVVLVGALVANFDKIKSALFGISKQSKETAQAAKDNADASQLQLENLEGSENILRAQGKSEKEIRDLKKQQTDETIKSLEAQLVAQKTIKDEQIKTAKRNRAILTGILNFLLIPITNITKGIDAIGKKFGKNFGLTDAVGGAVGAVAETLFSGIDEEGDEAIKETEKILLNLKNKRAGFDIQEKKERQENNKKKKEEEEIAKKELQELKDRIREAEANREDEIRALELQKIKEQNAALIKEAEAKGLLTEELQNSLNQRLAEKQAEFDAQDLARRNAINAERKKAAEKLSQEITEAEVNLQQAKANAIKGGLEVVSQLAGKSKALSAGLLVVEKGLAIAQVISNASKSIAQAKANLAATPVALGPVPNPMYAVQAVATAKGILATKLSAATSIATIAAQAIPSLSGGGGGGGSAAGLGGAGGGEAQPPSFNIVGASDTNQLADAIGGQTQQPVQAFVVANDVTTAQSLENNIVEGATL